MDPKDAKAWYNRGLAQIELEALEDAVNSFDNATRHDPNSASSSI
ncbi:MAG: tetratricopeptide repeat protein [Cyanobacteria bacterium J06632_22]